MSPVVPRVFPRVDPLTKKPEDSGYEITVEWDKNISGLLDRSSKGSLYEIYVTYMSRRGLMATLETLKFDNLALRSLPIDKETKNVIRQVKGACYSLVEPTPVTNPRLVACSLPAISLLDLPLSEVSRPEFVQCMSGNRLLLGSKTAAHCYCGHQAGYFSGQLGDGAAM